MGRMVYNRSVMLSRVQSPGWEILATFCTRHHIFTSPVTFSGIYVTVWPGKGFSCLFLLFIRSNLSESMKFPRTWTIYIIWSWPWLPDMIVSSYRIPWNTDITHRVSVLSLELLEYTHRWQKKILLAVLSFDVATLTGISFLFLN